ncbi:hypothetical protein GQ457_17G015030 [Hibiscus cannabinus]
MVESGYCASLDFVLLLRLLPLVRLKRLKPILRSLNQRMYVNLPARVKENSLELEQLQLQVLSTTLDAQLLAKGKSLPALILKLAWNGCIYMIWREINRRIFQQVETSAYFIFKQVRKIVQLKFRGKAKHGHLVRHNTWIMRGGSYEIISLSFMGLLGFNHGLQAGDSYLARKMDRDPNFLNVVAEIGKLPLLSEIL